MKRLISLLTVLSLIFIFPISVFADENVSNESKNTYVTYLDDGSYYVTTITESFTKSTKSGTKTTTHYGSGGNALFKIVVSGSFTYTGTTSTCTSVSHSVTVYADDWRVYSQNSYKSGNSAIADVVMKQKLLGIVVSTKNINLTLSCDANGNLS